MGKRLIDPFYDYYHDYYPDDDTIIVDVIDRAGTRHEFARVAPAAAWPAVAELVLEGARAEAARYHGTTQAYNAGDPTTPLPGEEV